jgi:hypothetical protein
MITTANLCFVVVVSIAFCGGITMVIATIQDYCRKKEN